MADKNEEIRELAHDVCVALNKIGTDRQIAQPSMVAVALLSAVYLITRGVENSSQASVMDGACVMLRKLCDMELAKPVSPQADPEHTGILH